ncbi:MAG: sulfate reduction electron transfer complex DsrMKJOP subunit DsrO [Candidatus Desantisbacteria bacterium]
MKRRDFLKLGGILAAAGAVPAASSLLHAGGTDVTNGSIRYGMVIDLTKCDGCGECASACRTANNAATFPDEKINNHLLRIAHVKPKFPNSLEQAIPLMCMHCDNAPCVHVCPVKASFVRKDGIVLIDKHRCIGCRYCMIACPYKARSFVFKHNEGFTNPNIPKTMHGVVEKCDFCVNRVDHGQMPVCVETCKMKAMSFGNLNDKDSQVSRLIASGRVHRVREDLHLGAKVYYLGL